MVEAQPKQETRAAGAAGADAAALPGGREITPHAHDLRVAQNRATLMNELHRVHGTMYGRLRPGQREFATFELQKQKLLREIAETMLDRD